MTHIIKVAILGAECTGKTTLAKGLSYFYQGKYPVAFVPEALRLFVDQEKRTPRTEEQLFIALQQKQQEAELASKLVLKHENPEFIFLFCDTTPLLTTIYSEVVFGTTDQALNKLAQDHDYDLTLFTQIDFPWKSDGIQRDGPLAQAKVHYRIQAKLDSLKIPYQKISGDQENRIKMTQQLITQLLQSHQF